MASENRRGCGYRKVGGLYLVGEYIGVPCDRLPFPLDVCPVCGSGIKVGRGMTKINPLHLFMYHNDCQDQHRPCFICDPGDEVAYLMRVGEKYYPTPEDFINEGISQGFSKRISQIPRDFNVGETIVYLAHAKACQVREPLAVQQAMSILEDDDSNRPRLIDAEKVTPTMGIFTAFIPHRIEKIFWQSEIDGMSEKDIEALKKRGITPVGVPDGDADHK